MNQLSQFLKEKRTKKKLNQLEFSKLLGISYQTYTKIERGVRKISNNSIVKIATVFKLPVEKVMDMNK
jgi:transcriptional regulator with XRE-family HTH domain